MSASKSYFVYILINDAGALYVGVTNNLERRVYEHKNKLIPGFTSKYKIDRLVYYEETPDITSAITYEKKLKGWTRDKKLKLISQNNPDFEELSIQILHPTKSDSE